MINLSKFQEMTCFAYNLASVHGAQIVTYTNYDFFQCHLCIPLCDINLIFYGLGFYRGTANGLSG